MKRFKEILVVADEASLSDSVIARARWLAMANEARLTLVDVIDASPSEFSRLMSVLPGARAAEVEQKVDAYHSERLEGIAAPLRSAGIEVDTLVLHGTAFIETIQHVLRNDTDLVLKAAHRGPNRPLLRAQDLHLLRKCPCPVWILNGEADAKARHIVAAIDPDPDDETRDGLSHVVMELATSLAQRDEAKLDIFNTWIVHEEATLRHSFVKMAESEISKILANEEASSKARLEALIDDFAEFKAKMRVIHMKGVAADVIPEHMETEGADTLVMGTVGRTGIAGFFIGNTAETILNRVNCSVIAVKPRGFVSPVTLPDKEDRA